MLSSSRVTSANFGFTRARQIRSRKQRQRGLKLNSFHAPRSSASATARPARPPTLSAFRFMLPPTISEFSCGRWLCRRRSGNGRRRACGRSSSRSAPGRYATPGTSRSKWTSRSAVAFVPGYPVANRRTATKTGPSVATGTVGCVITTVGVCPDERARSVALELFAGLGTPKRLAAFRPPRRMLITLVSPQFIWGMSE